LFIGRRERRTNNQREQTDRVAGRKEDSCSALQLWLWWSPSFAEMRKAIVRKEKLPSLSSCHCNCIAYVAKKLASETETPIGWQEVDRLPTKAIRQRTIRPLCHLLIINFFKVADMFSYASRL
jgi:hypothetical protein